MTSNQWLAQRLETGRGVERIVPMEGLRGLAVALVFLVHFHSTIAVRLLSDPRWRSWSFHLNETGRTGVDLFFVLSGFLIYGGLLARPTAFRPYIRRRARRVYPMFLVMLAVYVVLSAVGSDSSLPPQKALWIPAILVNLVLLAGILPATPIVGVAWSLSYEWWFYVVMPGVVNRARLRERTPRWRVGFWLITGAALLAALQPAEQTWRHLTLFVSGILLHEARLAARARSAEPARWLLPAGVAGLVAMLAAGWSMDGTSRVLVLLVAVPVFANAAMFGDNALGRVLSWRPVRWLGNMSYSYYLVHALVLTLLGHALAPVLRSVPSGSWVRSPAITAVAMVVAFSATLVASFAAFTWIERPLSIDAPGVGPRPWWLPTRFARTASGGST